RGLTQTCMLRLILLLHNLSQLTRQQLTGEYEPECTGKRVYRVGAECVYCYCEDGIVTSYRVGCPCHRSGPRCKWNKEDSSSSPLFPFSSSSFDCSRHACPVLNCLPDQQLKRGDHCCPICDPEMMPTWPSLSSPSSIHNGCFFRGSNHEIGIEFRVDACTQCVCIRGGLQCRRHVCSFLPSPLSSQCCLSNCRVDNHGKLAIRRNGTRWRSRSALCTCLNGRITCDCTETNESVSCYSQRESINGVGGELIMAPSCHYYLLVRTGLTLILRSSADNLRSLYLILRQDNIRVVIIFSSLNGESTVTVRDPSKVTVVEAAFVRLDPPAFSIHYNAQFILITNNDLFLRWNGRDFNLTSSTLNGTGICLSSPSSGFSRGKICSRNQYSFPISPSWSP
ncbi:hypothetical protein PFISCL1PPCAC_19405, partial [Pristionchus fissidentatus]